MKAQRAQSVDSNQSITSTEMLSSSDLSTNYGPITTDHQSTQQVLSMNENTNKRKAPVDDDSRERKRNRGTSFARARKGLNPAFKNPVPDLVQGKPAECTPVTRRPNTAPEATVLVPFTGVIKPRRSTSDTATASPHRANMSFSDLVPTSRVDDTSFEVQDSSTSGSLEILPITVLNDSRGGTVELETQLHEEDVVLALSQTSLHESEMEMGTRRMPSTQGTFHEQEPDHEKQISVMHPSSASTEIPSNPDRYIVDSSPLAHRSNLNRASVSFIDLTNETNESQREVVKRDVLGPVSSPVRSTTNSPSTTPQLSARQIKQKIRSLQTRIYCPPPTNSEKSHRTFVPQTLRDIADKFDLVNRFRPIEAVSSIKNKDRGYWKMLVKITSLAIVARSRRSPLSASQWSDERFMLVQKGWSPQATSANNVEDAMQDLFYPEKTPDTFTPWTLEEFVDFWSLMKKTIEHGRAGHDVHATITDNTTECEDGLEFEVRFYGYGEALSHMWLFVYILSNKATGYMPMQWMGTGKGPLLRMSGQPRRGGKIGRWVELSHGDNGRWGLEGPWEGIASIS